MPHLGTQPPTGFKTTTKQSFSGDNSTVAFTLNRASSSETDLEIFVDNIQQEPTTAYSVSGTTLTFTEAPPTGTNNVYVVNRGGDQNGLLPPQDLGTTDYIFGDDISFNSDGAVINFGLDSEINLTHVHNTGLLLNSTSQLQFGDSGTYIHQSADGVLDLVSDTELELNATTIDINGAVDISGNITLGGNIVSATTITTTGNEDSLTLVSSDADSNSGPHLVLDRQSASPADNDFLGQVVFRGKNDAGETVDYATMRGFISDATDGEEGVDLDIITQVAGTTRNRLQFAENETIVNTNQVDIDFRVESDGNANMLLVDAGNDAVLLGTTAATATFTLTSAGRAAVIHSSSSTNTQDLLNIVGNGNTTNNALRFWHGADVSLTGGTVVGTVTINSSSTAYNTSSDYRLKENVVTDWDATTRIKQLKPSRFNFKVDKDTTVDGFLAHEVSSIVPEAITGEKDAVDKDGNPEYQGIDQSKLVPILTKSLQEALTRIETLETKVSTLEGG